MPDGRVRLPANEFRSLSPARVHAAAVAGRALGWRWLPVGLLALGIALRVLAIVRIPVASDAAEYAVLGRSLLEGRGMWLPWSDLPVRHTEKWRRIFSGQQVTMPSQCRSRRACSLHKGCY